MVYAVWNFVYHFILKVYTILQSYMVISIRYQNGAFYWCVPFLFFLYIVREFKFIHHSFIIRLMSFWLSVPYSSLALVWLWCCCLFEEITENFGIYPSDVPDWYYKYASVFIFPFFHWIFLIFIEIKVDLIRWYWFHFFKFPLWFGV